jgi:hypothetical protein
MDQLMNTDEHLVIYGKAKPDPRQSLPLLDDEVDDYVRIPEPQKLFSPIARNLVNTVIQWMKEQGMSEDTCCVHCYSFARAQTFSTSVRYRIQFLREEDRTLFLLCRDELLNREEIFQ